MRTLGLAALVVVALAVSWLTFAQAERAPVGVALEQRLQKAPLVAPPSVDKMPTGWHMAGSDPKDYTAGLAPGRGAYIASAIDSPKGFGTLMQTFASDTYRGKRVRMSAEVRPEDVSGRAQLWMRVDGSGMRSLSFDNMGDRPITGNGGWQRYEIVLDVPDESVAIAFGILLAGKGKAYVDDFTFEAVPITVPVTGSMPKPSMPNAPVNPGFDD